tara:strand:+ start:454 stop:651 length:198 start_codon:yes stop_codon:yes gene_type:complete
MSDDRLKPLNKGDLIILKNLKSRFGVVVDTDHAGHITIQWMDGSKGVTYYTSITYDSNHEVIRAN